MPDRADAPEPHAQRLDAALIHDLNNSLAAIVAFSHLIRTDPSLPDGLRHHAAMLVAEADRTRQIVANLGGPSTSSTATQPAAGEDAVGETDTGPGTDETSRRSRILVVDDEPAIREFLARILRRSGYEVMLAANGPAALEIVRSDPPDAILCDHRMVGMSGIAFHEAVEAIDPGLARRFAFMSGDVLNAELSAFAVGHSIALLAKPFDIESVDRAVGGLVGPVQPAG